MENYYENINSLSTPSKNKKGNDRRKMGKRKSKIIDFEQKKRGFDPEIY